MKADHLIEAVDEAERFILRARALIAAHKAVRDTFEGTNCTPPSAEYYYSTPKEQGAVRRASLDLTRSLAQLRRRF